MRHNIRQWVSALFAGYRDNRNRWKYGPHAPKVAELIWVDPRRINKFIARLPDKTSIRNSSALVIDYQTSGIQEAPLADSPQIRSSYLHWGSGVPWEETEDYINLLAAINERGKMAGCRSMEDLQVRFRRLDALYESIAKAGTFKTQKELHGSMNFREFGGVQVGIDSEGTPILMRSSGYHRLAIAKLLDLPMIPAQVGIVDVNAISFLPKFRNP